MILDIIVVILIAGPVLIGYRRGIIGSGLRALSWVMAIVAGVFLTNKTHEFIGENFLYDPVADALDVKFLSDPQSIERSLDFVPEFIRGGLVATTEEAYSLINAYLANILVIIITFVIAVILLRLFISCIVGPLVRRYKRSSLGRIDKFCGAVLGIIEGLVLTFFVMAVVMVLISLGYDGVGGILADDLEKSIVAKTIYDNNILLLVTKGFFL